MIDPNIAAAGASIPADTGEAEDGLEKVIATLTNGVHGYNAIASNVESPTLRSLIGTLAAERKETAEQLMRTVADTGMAAEIDTDGTGLGAVHRTWLKLESMVVGDHAVVESIERAEEHAIEELESALEANVPEPVDAATRQALADVTSARDRLSEWRHETTS